jgi:hypothetical protein
MWNLFQRKDWVDETLSVISGNAVGLHVTIKNLPCRKPKNDNFWHYRYSKFGNDFIAELSDRQLKDFDSVASALTQGKVVRVPVKVKELPEVSVEIQGRPGGKREFYSDLADAIIDATEKNGIKP